MGNLRSSTDKRRKAYYYIVNIFNILIPNFFYRKRLKSILNRKNYYDRAYIDSRVKYYIKKLSHFEISNQSKDLNQLIKNQLIKNKQNSHAIDFYQSLRFFSPRFKTDFTYNTTKVIESDISKKIPDFPTIVKSRPITNDNQNSILLKLNQIKLFHFINDSKQFLHKKNKAVPMGDIRNNKQRSSFIKRFHTIPYFNIGQSAPKGNLPWEKDFMPIKEQLKYKFIFCLEGKCISTNLYWVMSSNSICVMPKPKYESWFMEGKLQQGVHYIEVKDDFSDAEEKIIYYINNPDKCLRIIKNAHNFVNQFKNKERERLIQLLVLRHYFILTGQYEN